MKKILANILVLCTLCFSSCGIVTKGVEVEQSNEYTKIILDNFEGKKKIEIPHKSPNESGLYYSTNITSGSVTVSCDLNYRKNLWKYGKTASEVMPELVAGCDVILGNEEDAEKVFGIKPEGFDVTATHGEVNAAEFESVCTQLMAKFPRARKVIITLRGSINANHNTWGGVLYSNGVLYQSPRYDITHIVDRVGGGDSFMGGLIYGLLTYTDDDQKALDFAVAASCLKHTIFGDFNQVTVAEVENLMKGDGSGRVSR